MKEITRVHIAKTAYEIELDAKRQLEEYMKSLEHYAGEADLLDDIEIRITEILLENGVAAGGVIGEKELAAVRSRLGEPSDFAEDPVAKESGNDTTSDKSRKLYRDPEAAILGGVLAGLGRFFQVNPIYVRLVFVVLLLGSFGTLTIAYLLMWLLVPPARTAAEKLRMNGHDVTLQSIKEQGTQEVVYSQTARNVRKAIRISAGVIAVAASVVIAVVTVLFGLALLLGVGTDLSSPYAEVLLANSWPITIAFYLFVLSGLLLSSLGFLLAYALFSAKFTKRMVIAVVAIIVSGLISFGSGLSLVALGVEYNSQKAQDSMVTTKQNLPDGFENVKKISVSTYTKTGRYDAGELLVQYVVSSDSPSYRMAALPDMRPDIVVDGDEARITFKSSAKLQSLAGWVSPVLTIYGPAIDEVSVEQGVFEYSSDVFERQSGLTINSLATTYSTIRGSFDNLTVSGAGNVDASQATVISLKTSVKGGEVEAGVVRNLTVEQDDVCPAGFPAMAGENEVNVRGVSSGNINYNGSDRPAKSIKGDCGRVVIDGDDDDEDFDFDN